ncbi:hypothetical protein ACIBI8_39020 [Streptomyces sp. NPDC050529]
MLGRYESFGHPLVISCCPFVGPSSRIEQYSEQSGYSECFGDD